MSLFYVKLDSSTSDDQYSNIYFQDLNIFKGAVYMSAFRLNINKNLLK